MLLKRGSTGNAVALVQYALNGVTTFPPKLRAFAPKTEEPVRQHQLKLRLRPDGIVGPLTLDSLFEIATLKGKVKFKPNGGVYRTDSTGSQSKRSFGSQRAFSQTLLDPGLAEFMRHQQERRCGRCRWTGRC